MKKSFLLMGGGMDNSKYNRRDFLKVTGIGLIALTLSCSRKKTNRITRPNIIYILADDLGYGDLSCYGQTKFQTPNVDRLAAEGMKFTDHYSGSTVCAPSRSSLMTGQHTGHTFIRGNKPAKPEGQHPLPGSTETIAKILKRAGYTTGAFGKWGLGPPHSEGDPNNQGFDEFFGYNCQRIAHHYYPWHLWHNQEKIVLKENEGDKKGIYGPDIIQEKTLEFIEKNQNNPFLLFVPSIIPHAELFAPEENIAKFRGKFEPEKSYKGTDSGPRFRQGSYGSQPESHAAFAAMVTLLDDQVGEILTKIDELNLDENTIIFFSSDNGPHKEGGADPDYFNSNGKFKGYKRDLYEGGIRVPFLVRWPNQIKTESVSKHVSAFWDMLPTFCDLAGTETQAEHDGISILPTLLGNENKQKKHEFLYWEFHEQGGKQAIRMGNWKGVRLNIKKDSNAKFELYNVKDDSGEENNVAEDHPEIVNKMETYLNSGRTESDIWSF